jgi:uncharacterized protein (DUF1330 family)
MTVYVLAQLSFTDRTAYDRYQARFMDVFRKFDGRLLAADEHPRMLEGLWQRDKVALLERDDFSPNRHPALVYWWSMIFSENRYPLFRIML